MLLADSTEGSPIVIEINQIMNEKSQEIDDQVHFLRREIRRKYSRSLLIKFFILDVLERNIYKNV